jgi:uncharacterized protein YyaL (SSP411 family)
VQDPRVAELEELAGRAADAVARDEPVDAATATLLLRQYVGTDAPRLRDALGLALAHALAVAGDETTAIGRASWLTLLIEATVVSDDERIRPAVEQLVAAARAAWPTQTRIDELAASIDACLRAAEILDPGELVQDAIDHLERAIGGSYRPGDGLVRDRDGIRVRCSLGDHVRGASALLTAFELTGRLPYSMLAEELMAIARRDPMTDAELVVQCETARMLCRLARLHDDPDYRGAAVIAGDADYRAQASRILAMQSPQARVASPAAAAAYGIALGELMRHVR